MSVDSRPSGDSNANLDAPMPGTRVGTAAAAGLIVLHDDADYTVAARHLPDVAARQVVDSDQ